MSKESHVHDPLQPDDHLDAREFVAALTDFGPGRSQLFGNSADEYLGSQQGFVRMGRGRAAWGGADSEWATPNRVSV